MSEHRVCRNCGNVLLPDEQELCCPCRPFADIVDGLLIPKNQAQSLSDFYRDERMAERDIVPLRDYEKVNR